MQPPVFGPSIVFGGQNAKWTGNENENAGIIALESRLNFETKAGILTLNYALGNQFNNGFDLRNGKIHFGLTALF